jgi:cell division protein FtsB
MNFFKKKSIRVVIVAELLVWFAFYYYADQGIRQIQHMQTTNAQIQVELSAFEKEIAAYEYELAQWNKFTFYKEKIARESLQMARPHDMVFYLTDAAHSE